MFSFLFSEKTLWHKANITIHSSTDRTPPGISPGLSSLMILIISKVNFKMTRKVSGDLHIDYLIGMIIIIPFTSFHKRLHNRSYPSRNLTSTILKWAGHSFNNKYILIGKYMYWIPILCCVNSNEQNSSFPCTDIEYRLVKEDIVWINT